MKNPDKTDFHVFETNHPYFIELGLGTFTTGTLLEWWNERDNLGRYLNRRHINVPFGPTDKLDTVTNTLQNLLGITDTTEFSWYGWKPNLDTPNAGRFAKQNLKGLDSNAGGEDSYIWSYAGKTTVGIGDIQSTVDRLNLDTENPVIGVFLSGVDPAYPDVQPLYVSAADPFDPPSTPEEINEATSGNIALAEYYAPLKDISPLYSLIQLNKFINHFDDYYPRETWELNVANTYPGLEKKQAFGSYALLNEIKSAKSNPRIQWSGDVTFFINQNNGLIQNCEITDNITFSLYLKDESMTAKTGKAVTMKEMSFVGPRRDAVGAIGGEDGERVSDDQEDVTRQAAGEVDLQWNPVTKKWQSGNVNMLCKLVTQLRPGKVPTLDHLLNNDIRETLEEEDNANCYIPSRGSGMLIRTQNSMPLQWSPNYAETADTRCKDEGRNKQIVPVYNFNPRKTYPSGEEVLLTQIDGVWHVSDLGRGEEEEEAPPVAVGIGRWGSFTYTMTSSQFFFKGLPSGNTTKEYVDITPRDAELNFHVNYYLSAKTDPKLQGAEDALLNLFRKYDNPGDEVTGRTPNGGYNFTQPFNTANYGRWGDVPAYFQQTSFDYLDSQIFGIRGKESTRFVDGPDKCSIASTSATLNSAGKVIPFEASEYPSRNAAHCGAFFGCLFPNGYQGTEIYDGDDPRTFLVDGESSRDANFEDYFNVDNQSITTNPFDKGNGLDDRNDVSVQTQAQVNQPFESYSIEQNAWSRGTYAHQANIFYLDAENQRKSMPADVMLNASPDGKNGSPIKPIGVFNDIYPTGAPKTKWDDPSFDLVKSVPNKVNEGVWLYRAPETGEADINVSAFDFQPVTRSNIMFRPLKMEAYLGMGQLSVPFNKVDADRGTLMDVDKWVKEKSIPNWGEFKTSPNTLFTEIATSTVSKELPIGGYASDREFPNAKHNFAGYERGNAYPQGPLKWGAWTKHKPTYTRLHEYNYWERNNAGGGMYFANEFIAGGDPYRMEGDYDSNWKGGGAFGIITTSLKVSANTTIEFTTKNLYGMGAAAAGEFTIQGGHAEQNKSWGVSNFIESYKQENIIDLSVRIYQGHPTEQTLYDPRYFAVHHFNPGVDFAFDLYQGTGVIPVNALGQGKPIPRNYLSDDFKNLRDGNGDLLDTVTYVFPEASGADIGIPSRWEKHIDPTVSGDNLHHVDGGTFSPIELADYSRVFKDATAEGVFGLLSAPKPPLMNEEYWLPDTKRNGKLLPYRYYAKTLGVPIPHLISDNPSVTMVAQKDVEGEPAYTHAGSLIVTNFGTGFSVDEAVGIFENDIILRVTAVGEGGSVAGLSVERFGSGIPVNKTRGSGDLIGSFTSNFTISPLVGAGEGFNGYFVSAGLQNSIQHDDKPFLIKRNGEEINRIAANEPGPKHLSTGKSSAAEPLAFIEDTETVQYIIPELLKTNDGSYDIFFHFHNDITMTWFSCGSNLTQTPWGDRNNLAEANEQYISIEGINLL